MESALDLLVESSERIIKFDNKLVRHQAMWVLFNLCLLIFDWQTFYSSPSHLTAFVFGAMAVTLLWSFVFFLHAWSELKDEKRKLKFLQELRETGDGE